MPLHVYSTMTIIPAAYSYCYNQANHASQSLTTLTLAATIPSHDPHFRRHPSKSSVKRLVGMLQTLRYVRYASCHHTPRSSRTLACGFACTGASQHKAAARHASRAARDAERHARRDAPRNVRGGARIGSVGDVVGEGQSSNRHEAASSRRLYACLEAHLCGVCVIVCT